MFLRIIALAMPRSTINFDSVRRIGLALPGAEESTAYGSPAQGSWKTAGWRAHSSFC
jgi:hypothetical protein